MHGECSESVMSAIRGGYYEYMVHSEFSSSGAVLTSGACGRHLGIQRPDAALGSCWWWEMEQDLQAHPLTLQTLALSFLLLPSSGHVKKEVQSKDGAP